MTDNQTPSSPHTSPLRHISWLTVVLALLAIGTFFAISSPDMRYYMTPGMGGGVSYPTSYDGVSAPPMARGDFADELVPTSVQSNMGGAMQPDYYPYPTPNVPANDTRELLKVNYNAAMQTRDVQGLTRRVETTVRGHSGRIDTISSAKEYGFVSFVVPMSKYDAFRDELETLVDSRFLTVNIQSQNMLPQKQSIEEQQKQADTTLADQKAARQKLVNAHASTVRSIQAQIDESAQELASLRAQTQTPEIQRQIQTTLETWSWFKEQMVQENASYSAQLRDADANIKYAQDWQTAVQKQDTALMDEVATVSGSVSVQWISLWEMAQLYLPGYWIPAIFAVLAFLSYLWDRRRFGTV